MGSERGKGLATLAPSLFAACVGFACWAGATALTYGVRGDRDEASLWTIRNADVLAYVASVAAAGLLAIAVLHLRRHGAHRTSWLCRGSRLVGPRQIALVTLLPGTGFLVGELVEHASESAVFAPSLTAVVAGVILQAVIGLVVFVAARGLLRVVCDLLAPAAPRTRIPLERSPGHYHVVDRLRAVALADQAAGRAPPALRALAA